MHDDEQKRFVISLRPELAPRSATVRQRLSSNRPSEAAGRVRKQAAAKGADRRGRK